MIMTFCRLEKNNFHFKRYIRSHLMSHPISLRSVPFFHSIPSHSIALDSIPAHSTRLRYSSTRLRIPFIPSHCQLTDLIAARSLRRALNSLSCSRLTPRLWLSRSSSLLRSQGCVTAWAAVRRLFGSTVSSFLIRSCSYYFVKISIVLGITVAHEFVECCIHRII